MIQILPPDAPANHGGDSGGDLVSLFAERVKVYPAKVHGPIRRLKWAVLITLLGLYYLMPWVRWERAGAAPDQAILVDVIGRKFYFFFIELWPQEIWTFTGLLLLAALGLFFATTLFGRVWCGYACPQTVWTDLFMLVERWFQGDRVARQRLDAAPWGFNKLWRKAATHATWVLIGLATGGAWVFYFNDAPTLWANMLAGRFDFVPTFWMLFLTVSTYIMAGHAREQVCTYMCPYARFQGAMFDSESLIVTYGAARGEPRGKGDGHGDCVDCQRCVAVCPTGIDIRNGQQYTCINCGLCVDACNGIMDKLGRPRGLIRYNTLHGAIPSGNIGLMGFVRNVRWVRPRTVYYSAIMLVVASALGYALASRKVVELNVLHQRNPQYVLLSNHNVRNAYTLRVLNKQWEAQTFWLNAAGVTPLVLGSEGLVADAQGRLPLPVKGGQVAEFLVFVDTPLTEQAEGRHVPLQLTIDNGNQRDSYASMFIFPDMP